MHSQWDDQERQLQLHLAERQQQLLLQHREQLLGLQQRLEKKQAPMLPSETLQQLRRMVNTRLVKRGQPLTARCLSAVQRVLRPPANNLSSPAAPSLQDHRRQTACTCL